MTTTATTANTTELWGGWFSLAHCSGMESLKALPLECIEDCSQQGANDAAVAYWVDQLDFDGPSWLFRSYLRQFGAWDAQDLADHNANRERVLWVWAGYCSEDPEACEYLYLS